MDISQVFNSSLEMGSFLQASTEHVTGSWFVTLLFIVLILIVIAGIFKMPETLYIIPLLPILLIFSSVDIGFNIIMGILALFFGYIIYTIIPVK